MKSLEVVLQLPPAPLVLADSGFLATLAQVEADVSAIKVTDAATAEAAAKLQARLTKAGTELEKQRVALAAPFLQAQRQINDAAKAPAGRIEAAKSALKAQLMAYDTEQRRLAADAERKRQDEIRKLEEQRRKEQEAEARRLAAIAEEARRIAAAAPVNAVEIDDDDVEPVAPAPKTDTEKKLEALAYAPAPVAARPAGVQFRVTLVPVLDDINKVPDMFIEKSVKMRAIISTFCAGYKEGTPLPEVPGIRFEVQRTPITRGAL